VAEGPTSTTTPPGCLFLPANTHCRLRAGSGGARPCGGGPARLQGGAGRAGKCRACHLLVPGLSTCHCLLPLLPGRTSKREIPACKRSAPTKDAAEHRLYLCPRTVVFQYRAQFLENIAALRRAPCLHHFIAISRRRVLRAVHGCGLTFSNRRSDVALAYTLHKHRA